MRFRAGAVAIILVLPSCGGAAAWAAGAFAHDGHHGPGFPPAEVQVRSADGRVSFPFTLVNNHVVFQATVAGVAVDLLLDTGMPMDGLMLYRSEKVDAMKLAPEEGMKARIAGAGGDGAGIEADIATGLTVDIGDLSLKNARAIVAPRLAGLADYHDGVIGATLFDNFVVAIDYDQRRVTLHDPKRWKPPKAAKLVPFTLEHNAPFVEVGVLDAAGRLIPATVVVDLGASHPISLNLGAVEGLAAPAGAIRTIVGFGVSGRVPGQVGRIAGLDIGGLTLRDVVATFPDSEVQRPGGAEFRGGNLGDGLLQRFNVAFDYRNRRLALIPNASFGRPFEWDMSGLWLQPDAQGALCVDFVVENSPAREAGVQVGDVVTRVNGRDVKAGDLPGLRETMRRAGEQLDMTVLRDGKELPVTLRTARLV
jgi:PDZ domain-containing protein/aspartyl protease